MGLHRNRALVIEIIVARREGEGGPLQASLLDCGDVLRVRWMVVVVGGRCWCWQILA